MHNLFGIPNQDNFPLEALPDNLRNTLREVECMVNSPIGLIASSMLSTMAIACQGAFNVRTPIGEVIPTSLFIVTIAESGERKTGTDKIFTQPIRDFENQRRKKRHREFKIYQSKRIVWDIHMQELQKSLRLSIKNEEETEPLREQIENLLISEPEAPVQMRLLYSDATIEALLKNLAHQWPSGAIHSSEGLSVLGGRTFLSLGPLSELWDGDNYINIDRLNAESYELKDARLSISLMIQLQPFKDFLEKKNSLAINSGLTARFLLAMPTSTQGSRQVKKYSAENKESNALQQFRSDMEHWLEKSEMRVFNNEPYQEFIFNADAEHRYLEILSHIEQQITTGGTLHDHRALASKLGNNLARIAALVHAFSVKDYVINMHSLESALQLIFWYTNQHTNFIKIVRNELNDNDLGNILYEWLKNHEFSNKSNEFKVTELYQKAPLSIRPKVKMQQAIINLESRGNIFYNRNQKPVTITMIKPYFIQPFHDSVAHPNQANFHGLNDTKAVFDPSTAGKPRGPSQSDSGF